MINLYNSKTRLYLPYYDKPKNIKQFLYHYTIISINYFLYTRPQFCDQTKYRQFKYKNYEFYFIHKFLYKLKNFTNYVYYR